MQTWVAAAFASAFFAGMVSILAKCGIKTTDSDVATALRTCVVLVFTWVMVAVAGSAGQVGAISGKSWLFLVLSGLATGLVDLLFQGAFPWRCEQGGATRQIQHSHGRAHIDCPVQRDR